jgi:hypothetical protein
VPPAAETPLADCIVTWGGAERWWTAPVAAAGTAAAVAAEPVLTSGHARPFDGSFGVRGGRWVSPAERRYSARLKRAFDPDWLFNADLSPALEDLDAH